VYLGGPAGARPSIGFDRAADLKVGEDFTSAIAERELAEHRLTRAMAGPHVNRAAGRRRRCGALGRYNTAERASAIKDVG
jgi:hypothetical protein